MNRFYKPTPREYVSTHVDMPWEFLQGVAEQKQKGFDAALATGDAASGLLNFEVNPGDVEAKKKIQEKYNSRILEAQDYVSKTGDFNTASRILTGVVRDIAQDPFISNMKAAVPIWKEQQKKVAEMQTEGEDLGFNNKWDYMHSTVDKETGSTRSYNQQLPYKARTLGKAVYDDFKDSIDGKVIQTWKDRVEKRNGEWVYKGTGKRLGEDLLPIMKTAGYEIQGRYPTYFRDRTAYEIKNGVSKEGETPMWLQSLMGGLASEYHVNNVETSYETDWKAQLDYKNALENPAPLVLPGQSLDIPGDLFDASVWDKRGLNANNRFEIEPGMVYDTQKNLYKVRDLTPAEDKEVKAWATSWVPKNNSEKIAKDLYLKGTATRSQMADILLAKENTQFPKGNKYFRPIDQKDKDAQFQYNRKAMGKTEKQLTESYIEFNEPEDVLSRFKQNKLTQEEYERIYPKVKNLATLFANDLKANTGIFGIDPKMVFLFLMHSLKYSLK